MARTVPWVAATLLVAAMIAPAIADPPRDRFPLSTYPMFAVDRGERATIATAVGRRASGEVIRLSPRLLAGTDEPILAVRTANRAVSSGLAGPWCAEVASRVAGKASDAADPVVAVEVRSETHQVLASVLHGAPAVAVEVHARCPVPDP